MHRDGCAIHSSSTFGTDFTQTGTATFTTTTGKATFAAGVATAIVTVDPTGDTTDEPNETAILTVIAGTGYTVGSPSGDGHHH